MDLTSLKPLGSDTELSGLATSPWSRSLISAPNARVSPVTAGHILVNHTCARVAHRSPSKRRLYPRGKTLKNGQEFNRGGRKKIPTR